MPQESDLHRFDQFYPHVGMATAFVGRGFPDADYILSGGLIKDLPPAPKVEFNFQGEGFDATRLSGVPAAGVHPRVIMSPSDIERMKKMVALGAKAPRFFRIHLEALRRNKDWKIPANFEFRANPFGEDGKIAGWAILARLTDDRALGRRAAEATVRHALYMELRIDSSTLVKGRNPGRPPITCPRAFLRSYPFRTGRHHGRCTHGNLRLRRPEKI
jgi:hypothetical protein